MKKTLTIALILFFCRIGMAQERNFLLWNQNGMEVKISDRFSVGVNEKIHYNPRSGELNMKFGDVFVKRHFTDWFEMGVTGRMLWHKEKTGWLQETRAMWFGNLSAGLDKLDVDFSNRIEYRMYEVLPNHFRHRQMLSVEMPPFVDVRWLKVYLAGESFFRFDERQIHLARLYSGTKVRYSNTFEMKVYYVLEKSRKPSWWNTSDVIGLNLNIEL